MRRDCMNKDNSIQNKQSKKEAITGHSPICDVCVITGVSIQSVSDKGCASGADYVLAISRGKCALLHFRHCAGFCV